MKNSRDFTTNFFLNAGEARISEERAVDIREQGETKLFIVNPEIDNGRKQEILIGARDIGAARCVAPVMKELLKRGFPVLLVVDQPAENFFVSQFKNAQVLTYAFPVGYHT